MRNEFLVTSFILLAMVSLISCTHRSTAGDTLFTSVEGESTFGENLNASSEDDSELPPLHKAVLRGDKEQVKRLILAGTDVDQRDDTGMTALLQLTYDESSNKEMAEILLKAGADVDAVSMVVCPRSTPLHHAVNAGSMEMSKLLISYGADIEARTMWGETPLHIAAKHGFTEIAEYLMSRGANINEITGRMDYGWAGGVYGELTPLHIASEAGQVEMVKLLLQHGADACIKDIQGRTPLDLVREESAYLSDEEDQKNAFERVVQVLSAINCE